MVGSSIRVGQELDDLHNTLEPRSKPLVFWHNPLLIFQKLSAINLQLRVRLALSGDAGSGMN